MNHKNAINGHLPQVDSRLPNNMATSLSIAQPFAKYLVMSSRFKEHSFSPCSLGRGS